MNNKMAATACAGLLALGLAGSASAEIVNVNFTGYGDSIDYVFDLQNTGPLGATIDLMSASYNVGGVSSFYDAANYNLAVEGFEVVSLAVYDSLGDLVSRMTFDGYFELQGGSFGMYYYGDQTLYSGASYEFNSVTDFQGSLSAMLYDQMSTTPAMTSVSVSTVSAVPVPAAVWLFGSGLMGLVGVARRRA